MPDLTPNHPAVLAALNAETQRQRTRVDAYADDHIREMVAALTATLPHLTADDLPARLVRGIQARTIRATARAVTYEEDDTPQDHEWDRAAFSALLNELADNIERDGNA